MSNIGELHAELKFNMTYTCSQCGKTQVGTTIRTAFRGYGILQLREFLEHFPRSSQHMPVGWRYHDRFYCEPCKD